MYYRIKNSQYQTSNNHYRKDKTLIDQRESEEERQGPWTMLLSWVAGFNYLVSLQIKFSPTLMTYEHPWFFKTKFTFTFI